MMPARLPARTELLIVGGGPAGLAAAIAARLCGRRVDLVDRRRPPLDKACGEGLMPDGVRRLRELGIDPAELRAAPFRGIRFVEGETRIEGRFGGAPGLGIRRTRLHARLAARAASVGVRLHWGVRALALEPRRLVTDAGTIEARWLVGADGLGSPVRRWAGWERAPARRARFGISRHYAIAPWSDLVEVHWADRLEAYVTPLGRRELGVTLLCSGDGRSFDQLLAALPSLAARLAGAPRRSRDRGAGPLFRRARRVHNDWLALVGDAAGYVDAISGEGLALAFHHAFALARALEAGDLARYGAAHRRLARLPERYTRALLLAERHAWLRRSLFRLLAARPRLFSRCLDRLTRPVREVAQRGARARISRAWARLPRASA